ncbi:tetratricopeptide repeat protein [Luteolibacter flavescens]|uniref:Tetratricopeptide repeat protein n=1 Tax=Luteolibacter flavescens TaxID=1859460 RepID=A0ABT3FQ02_9BACT|nr:tetratricopeptide repeat protein [Luteolibacter flavescens]MCW1885070.1 tetratricopeptide repeat protein [Luteolibacter flavescens]
MNSNVPACRKALALLLAAAPLLPAQQAPAPPPAATADASDLSARALVEMEADRWSEALDLLTRCVAQQDDAKALQLYGPSFGVTWYRKGICELRLKRWDDAAKSFETCYVKFPNPSRIGNGNGKGSGSGNGNASTAANIYHKRALLRWGEAAQGAGRHGEAIRLFDKFMEERDKTRDDEFDPGSHYLNLAICHFRLGQISQGIESLETSIQNKPRFRAPDSGIIAAFQAFVEATIAKRDEKPLLSFLGKYRSGIVLEPFEMEPYAGLFLKLAADAQAADMDGAALVLCQLVPPSDVMTADLKSRLERLGNRPEAKELTRTVSKAKLQGSLDALAQKRTAGEPLEVAQLGLVAVIHEKRGNLRGALAAYRQLEQYYPKTAKREDHLFHLVRTTAVLGEPTAECGERFLKDFPDSKHVPAVRRLLLASLYQAGDYGSSVRVADELLPKLSEGSAEHDQALFVLGASHYHLGHYDQAHPLLDRHVEKYPQSAQRQAARYFQASDLARLRQWGEAAAALDRFLAEDPGLYLPFALYDRATCHLAQEQEAEALEKLGRLENEFPATEALDAALALKGRILQGDGKTDEAIAAYTKALTAAEDRDHPEVAAESLCQLVTLLGARPEAVAHADRFWKAHADSPLRLRMAVVQIEALEQAGRGDEALGRLRECITPTEAPGLQDAIDRYAAAYFAKHGPDELEKHFGAFPGIDPAEKAATARLKIAVIGVMEKQPGEPAATRVKALYQELKSGFSPADLAPATLVQLGDHLRTKTSAPRQALPYYEEALARPDASLHVAARFGRAAVLATGSPEEKAGAIEDFKRVALDATDEAVKDLARFRIAETQFAAGDSGQAAETARQYLALEGARLAPEANLLLGKSYEALAKPEEALAAYREVWSKWQDNIRLSAPAMVAWLDLSVRQGKPADIVRETALNYLVRTKPAFETMNEAEKVIWQDAEARTGALGSHPTPPPAVKEGEKP